MTQVRSDQWLNTRNKLALVIEYRGTGYRGFQVQNGVPTVQGELEKAIFRLTGEKIRVMAASRTDAGTHAWGQVVSFRVTSSLSLRSFISGLNYYLPSDIAVKSAYRIADTYDVRRRAVSREYRYHIINRSSRSPLWEGLGYHLSGLIDIEKMNLASKALLGKRDMASFVTCIPDNIRSTIRTVYRAEVTRKQDLIIFHMVADSFLPHQVRNTVGALIGVGRNKMEIEEFYHVVVAAIPGLAGPTVPACGLYLMKINYAHPFEEEFDENL